jgi:LemA protein
MFRGKALGCLAAVVLLVVILAVAAGGSYNRLVGLSQGVDAQWAQVESTYQRRADLIPNLVAAVQGAAAFEKSTLESITQARASVGQMQGPSARDLPSDPEAFARGQAAQDQLSGALSRLLVVVERYPDLKANQNFRDLQAQLEGTENRISVERMRYNETAREYNTARQRFPSALFASVFGFREKAYFRAQPEASQAPKVQFDFGASPRPLPAGSPGALAPAPGASAGALAPAPAASARP